MVRFQWICIVAALCALLSSTHAFQVGHHAAPTQAASSTGNVQKPATYAKLFAGYSQRLQASPELGNDGVKKSALGIRMRKFILALFKILMRPLRVFRSSSTTQAEPEIETLPVDKIQESEPIDVIVVEPIDAIVVEPVDAIVVEPIDAIVVTGDLLTSEESNAPTPVKLVEGDLLISEESNAPAPIELVEAAFVAEPIENTATATLAVTPQGDRWATATSDLSGDWVLMATDEFKQGYDGYLKRLGQPLIVRGIALGIIGLTSEITKQTDEGRTLSIRGTNARGVWERSLISSGADGSNKDYEAVGLKVVTADGEAVQAEAWWEEKGTVHCSWMRGVSKYGGGDFESRRYLENDGKVLVCETIFHPQDVKREKAQVIWKFLRKGASL